MKWLVLAFLVTTISCFGYAKEVKRASSSEGDAECLAGTRWRSYCHNCFCRDDGAADCTLDKCNATENTGDPVRCKLGTMFKKECNMCTCVGNGFGLCTLKKCTRTTSEVFKASVPTKAHLNASKTCAPGTKWKSQCNDCECSQDGYYTCTLNPCPGQESEPKLECLPGSEWEDDCNECFCSNEGVAQCLRTGCIGPAVMNFGSAPGSVQKKETLNHTDLPNVEQNTIHVVKRRSVCKPNENFQSDCNSCKCSADGLTYKCSQNECMDKEDAVNKEVEVFMESEGTDHIERHSVCQPRGIFYIGCNTCHCNYFGTDYSCTNKPCPLPEDVELFHELKATRSSAKNKTKVCVANRMFVKDCNTCWCNEDGTSFFCTRKVCIELPEETDDEKPEELRILKRECRPDEVFELDCNMCRCNPDGMSYSCTRRACIQDPVVEQVIEEKNTTASRKIRAAALPQEPLKTCTPGSNFRMDCNTCLCDNEGTAFSCTRLDCRALNNNNNGGTTRRKREVTQQEVSHCEPGAVFDQGCNVCRCTNDGRHAMCTLKRCSLKPEEAKEDSDAISELDPNFRCNPGEQFKRGCNDCTCSADGRSVFCTLRICEKDLMPRI